MSFVTVNQAVKDATGKERYAGRGRTDGGEVLGVLFATDVNHGGKKKNSHSVRIRLGTDVVKDARLIKGDRVDFLFDPKDKLGKLVRVTDGGWKLTSLAKKSRSLTIKMSWSPGLPSIASPQQCENVVIDGACILFEFPKNTSFNGMARK